MVLCVVCFFFSGLNKRKTQAPLREPLGGGLRGRRAGITSGRAPPAEVPVLRAEVPALHEPRPCPHGSARAGSCTPGSLEGTAQGLGLGDVLRWPLVTGGAERGPSGARQVCEQRPDQGVLGPSACIASGLHCWQVSRLWGPVGPEACLALPVFLALL